MTDHSPRRRAAAALSAILAAIAGSLVVATPAAAFVPKKPPLTTPWTNQVSLTNPLPEYPRPQLVRKQWQSLNGVWQFGKASNLSNPPINGSLPEEVLVPYPIESGLSGIQRHENYMFYRRSFTVPAAWNGRRVQLNFGAVMWEARVWVNGVPIGNHTGGYDPFTLDITRALHAGSNSIVVGVSNLVDADEMPIGKQRLKPEGIWYTPYSGIWQTVWMEPINAARITQLDTTPNLGASALDIKVRGAGVNGQQARVEVLTGGKVVGQKTGAVGATIRVPVPNAHLWTPDDPFLYDLRVTLTGPGGGDQATGYFGMRSVGKAMLGGVLRPTLNGKFIYHLGTLDQGYWPDGISTAPTDAALRFDLEQQKALGFNMVRKHIKVESARWFYHADRLGLMVWQDMPAVRTGPDPGPVGRGRFESELRRMVDYLRGITSIVMWVPFNEGWGEYDAGRITDEVASWDPTRLVNHNSGSNCCASDPDPGNGDVIDDHHYVGPAMTRSPSSTRVAMLGEYGGLGMRTPGHEWSTGPFHSPEFLPNSGALTQRYIQAANQLIPLISTRGMSGSVYTEPTDVENEINGFFTYDRQIKKMDFARVRDVHLRILAAARGASLPTDQLISLKVTTAGFTNRSLRHLDGAARTDVVNSTSPSTLKQDATFWVRPGLADGNCYSLESRNYPGRFLHHRSQRVHNDPNDGSAAFAQDATFCAREGLSGGGTSLESKSLPGYFIRHRDSEVWIDRDNGGGFRDDATWSAATPWWQSGADLPEGQARSFRVTTPGYTDRYLRHSEALARTDVIAAGSTETAKQDATFIVRAGLADSSCYSLESRNFPGRYLRHQGFRVRNDPNDGSTLFAEDATFCAQPPRAGGAGNVSLESFNIRGRHIRHINAEVYISVAGGGHPWDNHVNYNEDITWNVAVPWA